MEAELALEAWKKAAQGLKATAFAAYRSALDREEQAAAALASRLVPHVGARLRERWATARGRSLTRGLAAYTIVLST